MTNIKTELWDHQHDIAYYLEGREYALVAAEMATGKTLALLEFASRSEAKRVLIVAPKLACEVWASEIQKHVKNWHMTVATRMVGTVARKAEDLQGLLNSYREPYPQSDDWPHFVVVNYDIVWRTGMIDTLLKEEWDVIVADESHRIKSHKSKVSKGMYRLAKANYGKGNRVCLTGTPLPNGREDIFGQARFLNDEVFGKFNTKFLDRYTVRIPIPGIIGVFRIVGYRNKDEYQEKVDSFTTRLTLADTKVSMPPKQHVAVNVRLTAKTRKYYEEMKQWMITEVNDEVITAANVLVKGLRLQQITGGLLVTEYSEKQEALQGLLEELPEDEPIVVFAKFHRDIENIIAVCEKLKLGWSEVSGRKNSLTEWVDGKTQVLIVQIDTGSESIDLTRACYTVFYSNTWNSAVYQQALARVYRPPKQTRPVTYYHLLAEDTIDHRVFTALKNKHSVSEAVLGALT